MESLDITLEFGLWGALTSRLRGASWRAMFVDHLTGQRCAGSADCVWEAIAWALHERELRRAGRHAMSRNEDDRPGVSGGKERVA